MTARKMSEPEWNLLLALKAARLPLGEAEFRFHPTRRWRLDRAWTERRVAIEVEGGVYSQGRHTRGSGFHADLEKYLEAQRLGWTVIRIAPDMIGRGVELLRELLARDMAA